MIDQPSEYLPANNANDKHVIPMHAPIPGVDAAYAAALRARSYRNYTAARALARQAYESCDPDSLEYHAAIASEYMDEVQAYNAFIADIIRVRQN